MFFYLSIGMGNTDTPALLEVLAESDDDLEIWASLVVGFDAAKNFIVRFEYTNYEERARDYDIDLLVEPDEAFRLARLWRVRLVELPRACCERFGRLNPYPQPVPSQVKRLFGALSDALRENGIRVRRVRRGSAG